jgi:hypothetical protein
MMHWKLTDVRSNMSQSFASYLLHANFIASFFEPVDGDEMFFRNVK